MGVPPHFLSAIGVAAENAPAALPVEALSQIDTVLAPDLERSQHLRPSHAVVKCGRAACRIIRPTRFADPYFSGARRDFLELE